MELPTSSKNIWIVLSGTSMMKSREFIGSMLERNATKLLLGYSYYLDENASAMTSNQAVKDLIEPLKSSEVVTKMVEQLKKFLNLTDGHCKELFCLYLINQFRGSPTQLKQLCALEKNNQSLLNNLHNFYYSERLFTMYALKQILSHSGSGSSHPYSGLFRGFLDAYDKDSKLFDNLLKQYEELLTLKMPTRSSNGPYIQDKITYEWTKQNIQEHIELLQTMIIYFDAYKVDLNQIVKILELFEKYPINSSYSDQTNNGYVENDKELKLKLQFIMFLESILLVQTLDLEKLTRCMLDNRQDHHILNDDASLIKINSILMDSKCLKNSSRSPLHLGWMIVRSWELSAFPDQDQSCNDVQKLMAASYCSKVFTFLKIGLDSDIMNKLANTKLCDVIYDQVQVLLSSLLELYDMSFMNQDSTSSIENLIQTLLKSEKSANKIFSNNFSNSLGKILTQSCVRFPYSFSPYIDCQLLLARTSCCYQAFKSMRYLNTYTEILDMRNQKLQLIGQEGIYRLLEDRRLFRDDSLILPANTIGHTNQDTNFPIITWKNVSLDAWNILRHTINEKINVAAYNDFTQLNLTDMNEISSAAELCYETLKRLEPSMCPQVLLLVQSCHMYFDALVQRRRPPRLYMASCLKLISIQIQKKVLNVNTVITNLQGRRFLPYMIGLTHNLYEISSGKDTNSSTIGELIASEECIRGTYELCKAFLEFISVITTNINQKENNQWVLASLVYILNEVYPSHHLWSYKDVNDMETIKKLCMEIFHRILSNISKSTSEQKSNLQIVSIIGLTQNEAHRQLLETIKKGEHIIKYTIDNSGSDLDLAKAKQIIMLRQSLMVFNYLLAHTNTVEEYCDLKTGSTEPSHNVTPNFNQTIIVPLTELEKILFSTNVRPGFLSNLLFYVYQQYDSTLACLAVQLIKRIAKKFSLSLMACLGSEAESICEFFLSRLEAVTEDINLKVAILDLLSVCINHQPGLMEMFLRASESSNETNETTNCLPVLMEIFEGSQAGQPNNPKQLHVAALKFIFTFWQRHHSAVESLTKTPNFWKLITFPLNDFISPPPQMTDKQEENTADVKFKDKLYSYIFMLLAREIFFLDGITSERKISPDLTAIYKSISENDILRKYSRYVNDKCSESKKLNEKRSNLTLIAWRDFLVSYIRYQPFTIQDETKSCILEDLLSSLIYQLSSEEKFDRDRLALVGEVLLLVSGKWLSSKKSSEETYKVFHRLLYLVDESKDQLPFTFLLSFQSTISIYLMRQRDDLSKLPNFSDFMVPTMQIMKFSIQLFEKFINTSETNLYTSVESRLCLSSIMALRFIIDIGRKNVTLWLSYLQTNLKVDTILQFIITLLERRKASNVCHALIELLICLSSIEEAADYLKSTNIVEHLNMAIVSAYQDPQLQLLLHKNQKDSSIAPPLSTDLSKIEENLLRSWVTVYHQIIKLNISLMTTLGHQYLNTAINFLTIHCSRICETLEKVRFHLRSIDIEESRLSVAFVTLLTKCQGMWIRQSQQCFDAINEEISKTAHSIVAFWVRPSFLQYILEHPSKSVATMIGAINKTASRAQNSSGPSNSKIITSAADNSKDARWDNLIYRSANHNQLETFQRLLMNLLGVLLTFMYRFSPTVLELISQHGLGKSSWKHSLSISFGVPTLDPSTPLTYGSLLQSFSHCVKRFKEIDEDPDSDVNTKKRDKNTLMYIQEKSLSILLSQALIVYSLDEFTPRDRQLISRELRAELGSTIQELNGQPETLNRTATAEAFSTKDLPSQLNKPYMKVLLQLVEKAF